MGADASGLRRAVTRWKDDVARSAAHGMAVETDRAVPIDTGETARSRRVTLVASTSLRSRWRLEYPTPQAGYTDRGTGPHPITPHPPRRFLRFYSARAGRMVFARRVLHPGSRKHVGWFSQTVQRRWGQMVREAVRLHRHIG